MIKLIKLIYVNLLSLLDYNKIVISQKENTKSGYEYKATITIIISLIYGYISYKIMTLLGNIISDSKVIIDINFIFTTLLCLVLSLYYSTNTIYTSDNEYLFSMPIEKKHIIISKLFIIYIKVLLLVLIFTFSSILSYSKFAKIDEAFVLIIFILDFVIPIIPILLSCIISYLVHYVQTKGDLVTKILLRIVYIMIIAILFVLVSQNKNMGFNVFFNKMNTVMTYIYPLYYLFQKAIFNYNIIALLISTIIPLILLIILTSYLSNNYIKLCSMLKRVDKKSRFNYKQPIIKTKSLGIIKKEFFIIFKNKIYSNISFKMSFVLSILIVFICVVINPNVIKNNTDNLLYFNTFIPAVLSSIVCLNSSSIAAISIEQDNIEVLKTFPISFNKVLLSKFFIAVFIQLLFIIFNATIIGIFMKPSLFTFMACLIIPLLASIFTNILYLLLDYKFCSKKEMSETTILNGRLLSFIPSLTSILLLLVQLFLPIVEDYRIINFTYGFIYLILIIVCLVYFIINNKKMYEGLSK